MARPLRLEYDAIFTILRADPIILLRDRLRVISHTLKTFCEGREAGKDADGDILALLGAKTEQKHWLAASLDKIIRMQQGF